MLLLFVKNNFSQNCTNMPKHIIEVYFWKGPCSTKTNLLEKMTLEVYSDSTYIIKPVECRSLYNTKKEWKAHKNWVASGTFKLINGQRVFYQGENEMVLKQYDKYITYKEIYLLKIK